MTFLEGAIIAGVALAILTGEEPECPEFTWTDDAGIEWTEEVCLTGGGAALDYAPAQFDAGPGAVPEPATWAVMVLGFGSVGAALRGRRRFPPLRLSLDPNGKVIAEHG